MQEIQEIAISCLLQDNNNIMSHYILIAIYLYLYLLSLTSIILYVESNKWKIIFLKFS